MGFSHHERCPECAKQGKDRSGNNLAVYEDGGKYCFSCGHKEHSKVFRRFSTSKKDSTGEVDNTGGHSNLFSIQPLSRNLPKANQYWLEKYLTKEEVAQHFTYSESLRRHVFSHGGYWEGRTVLGNQPKVLSHGDKPFILFGSGGPIVVVEDVVSAIKIGRVATGLPLFGNSLPPEWMARIARLRPVSVFIWLDSNMVQKARKTAMKMNRLVPCRTIETDLDPKCYSTEEIMEYLK